VDELDSMGFALKSQVRTDDRGERCNTAVLWRGCCGPLGLRQQQRRRREASEFSHHIHCLAVSHRGP